MADRIGIIVELTGDKEAASSLEKLKKLADALKKENIKMKVDATEANKKVADMQKQLDSLQKDVDGIKVKIDDSQANGAIREMTQNAITLRDVLSGIGDVFSGIGSGLQSIGRMFGGDILSTARRTLTAYGTIMATQGLGKASSRFDTFRTFPKLMEAAGYSSSDASEAVEKLNQSVLGLPTALNDIVDSAKQYILLTGDMKKGTDLAIASNNAFLANASDAAQVRFGMNQIRDILAKGTLRSQEWDSLFGSLGISLQYIAEEMGTTSGKLRSELKDGKIDAMDFVDALIRVGTEEGKLVELANIQKDTLSATAENIKNAFSNLGASTLQALDEILVERTGQGLPATIKMVSDAIKSDLIPAVKDWVSLHADDIVSFLDKLKNYDWMGLLTKIGTNVEQFFGLLGKFLGMLPEDAVQDFIAFAMVWATPLGKAFSAIGGMFKALSRLNLGGLPIFNGLGKGGTEVASLATNIKSIFTGFVGFTLTAAEIAEIGAVIYEYAKLAEMIGNLKIGDDFGRNAGRIALLFGAGGAITLLLNFITSSAAPMSAVGELLAGGFIIEMGLLAKAFEQYANLAQVLSDMKVDWTAAQDNANRLAGLVTDFSLTSFINSLIAIPGMIGSAELSSIAGTIQKLVDAVTVIGEAEFPSVEKINQAGSAFNALKDAFDMGVMESIGTFFGNLFGVYDAESNKISKGTEMLKLLLGSIDDINSIASQNVNASAASGKIKSLVESLATMSEDIQDAFGGDLSIAGSRTGQEIKVISNITGFFEKLDGALSKIEGLEAYFGQRKIEGVFQPSLVQGFEATKDGITQILKGTVDMLNVLTHGNYADALAKEMETGSAAKTLGYITDAFGHIDDTLTYFRSVSKSIKKITGGNRMVYSSVGTVLSDLKGVMRQISGLFGEDVMTNLPNIGMENDTETWSKGSIGERLAGMASAMEMLKDVMYQMRVINGNLTNGKGESIDFTSVGDNIRLAIEGLNSAFGAIPDDAEGTVLEKTKAFSGAVTQLQTAMTTLQSIKTSLSAGGEEGGTDVGGITQMITDITTALINAQVDTSGIEAIATSVQNVKERLSEMASVDVSGLTGQLSSLKGGLDNVRSAAIQAKAALEQLGGAGSNAAGRLGSLSGVIARIASACFAAAGAARALQSAINGLQSKTVNVRVNVQKTGSISMPNVKPSYPHTGGLIGADGSLTQYRARGGSIFRPKGTDTVPAMLTPGEYVMRRQAVQTFGVDFMKNINRLNIPAALKSLVSRTNIPVAHSTVINNSKHYDNHASVNQTFINSNTAFAFRRANRFVEAL